MSPPIARSQAGLHTARLMNNNIVAKLLRLSPLLLLLGMLGGQHAFAALCHASCYHQTAVIAVKSASSSSWSYDDGFIDQSSSTLYLADRTARAVDIIDLRLNTFVDLLTGGLTGPDQEHKVDGPNHVLKVANDLSHLSIQRRQRHFPWSKRSPFLMRLEGWMMLHLMP